MSDRAADRAPAGDGPLRGVRVAVTRPVDQAQALVALLEATGADVVVVPLIEIVDVDGGELAGAVADLGPHDWIVVASPNGANRVAPLLPGVTARRAAVGATTAATLGRVDLVPARQSAEGLLEEFPMADAGGRVVVVQSADGEPTLVEGLTARGWSVRRIDTHRAQRVRLTRHQQFDALRADAVVFTSGSQARAWADELGSSAAAAIVAIGPQTAAVAESVGLKVSVIAADHSLAGSVSALVDFFRR